MIHITFSGFHCSVATIGVIAQLIFIRGVIKFEFKLAITSDYSTGYRLHAVLIEIRLIGVSRNFKLSSIDDSISFTCSQLCLVFD